MLPLYDIDKSYQENLDEGPFFSGNIPKRKKGFHYFLGHEVASPIGVPAGPLLGSKWIKLAAKLGFDILTYKTIRSSYHASHPLPNVRWVKRMASNQAVQIKKPLDFTITNSFGMPSQSPEYLIKDIAKAHSFLAKDQVMIVSVMGSDLNDFVKTATFAKDAGVKIIEANFSCPNVDQSSGMLYQNERAAYDITRAIKKAIHPLPLILKVGLFDSKEQMRNMLIHLRKAGADAICGLNTVSMSITPPLDQNRQTSGVCGDAIRQEAFHFCRDLTEINAQEKLGLTLMGVGGMTKPSHFRNFLNLGLDAVLTASGMMFNPYLAMEYHKEMENESSMQTT